MGMSCRGLTRVWIDLHLLVIPQFAVDHILTSSPPPYITAWVLQKIITPKVIPELRLQTG